MNKKVLIVAMAAVMASGVANADRRMIDSPSPVTSIDTEVLKTFNVDYWDVSATVTGTTDYRFRGITQNDDNPALQGSVDFVNDNGLYVGAWASNIDFDGDSDVEIDYYVGHTGDITENVDYDIGYIYYDYPGESDWDYQEFYGTLGTQDPWLNGRAEAGLAWSDDFGEAGHATYTHASYHVPTGLVIQDDVNLKLHAGWSDFDDGDDYMDYKVGLDTQFFGMLDAELAYVDTSSLAGNDDAIVATVGITF